MSDTEDEGNKTVVFEPETSRSDRIKKRNNSKETMDMEKLMTEMCNAVLAIQNQQVKMNESVDLLLRKHSGKLFNNPPVASGSNFSPISNSNQSNAGQTEIPQSQPTSTSLVDLGSLNSSILNPTI